MNRLGMRIVSLVGLFYGISMFVLTHAPAYANPPDLNPNCTYLPNSVTVTLNRWADEYGVAPGTPVSMTMEDYAWGVLVPELGATVPSGTYAGSGWDKEVIKAQAIAARTIGAYKCNNLTATSPQRFRPYWSAVSSTVRTRFQNVSRKTRGMYMTWNGLELEDSLGFQGQYQASIIDAEYRSDTGNPTCSWNSRTDGRAGCDNVSGYRYLKSVNNQYYEGSPGPGFGQWSAHSWRKADDRKASYGDLLHKYYTGVWIQDDYYANYSEKFYTYNPSNGTCGSTVLWQGSARSINYYWANTPPNRPGVPADNFCVRWETTITFDATDWYTFYLLRDDGMRLYVDNTLIIDRWSNSSSDLQSVSMHFSGGTSHSIRLDYYDAGFDAVARFSINRSTGLVGRYYDRVVTKDESISGDYIMLRPDVPIRFDWVQSSPLDPNQTNEPAAPRIGASTFSTIWQGYIYVQGCHDLIFKGRYDDGMYSRLFTASNLPIVIFDDYVTGSPRTSPASWIYRCDGLYKVEVRYFEQTVNAVSTFDWWLDSPTNPNDPEADE